MKGIVEVERAAFGENLAVFFNKSSAIYFRMELMREAGSGAGGGRSLFGRPLQCYRLEISVRARALGDCGDLAATDFEQLHLGEAVVHLLGL